jgi:hypothetical protein
MQPLATLFVERFIPNSASQEAELGMNLSTKRLARG